MDHVVVEIGEVDAEVVDVHAARLEPCALRLREDVVPIHRLGTLVGYGARVARVADARASVVLAEIVVAARYG
jgi:hypothetical protein